MEGMEDLELDPAPATALSLGAVLSAVVCLGGLASAVFLVAAFLP